MKQISNEKALMKHSPYAYGAIYGLSGAIVGSAAGTALGTVGAAIAGKDNPALYGAAIGKLTAFPGIIAGSLYAGYKYKKFLDQQKEKQRMEEIFKKVAKQKTRKIIQEMVLFESSHCPTVPGFTSNSNIVKSWAEKYSIPLSLAALFWRRAELIAARSTKCRSIPFPLAVEIFKAEMKKYGSKCDKDIKYSLPNPELRGEKVKIHYDEAKGVSIDKIVEQYKKEIQQLENECKGL